MVEIFNVEVFGEAGSLIASGYPMRKSMPEEGILSNEISEKRLEVAGKLGSVPIGTGHDNFLKGIIVQFDIKYPQYFTPQLQRYNFLNIVSSMSKMHCLTKFNLDAVCNKYVSKVVKEYLRDLIQAYNDMERKENLLRDAGDVDGIKNLKWTIVYGPDDKILNYYKCFDENSKDDTNRLVHVTKYELYMMIISNCPMGLEMVMRCSTNLQQLKTIHAQRRHHKLKEDWGSFCDWIESLRVFQEHVIKYKKK